MIWRFFKRAGEGRQSSPYFITFRMQTGAGRLEAATQADLTRLLGDLRLAGASDITIVDVEGRLVAFDPGGHEPAKPIVYLPNLPRKKRTPQLNRWVPVRPPSVWWTQTGLKTMRR